MKKILLLVFAVVLGGMLYLQLSKSETITPGVATERAKPNVDTDNLPAVDSDSYVSEQKSISSLRVEYERSDDLFMLARAHVNTKDPESLWLVAKIVDYCAPFGMDPKGYAAQTDVMLPLVKPMERRIVVKSMRERMLKRCRGFEGSDSRNTFKVGSDLVFKTMAARAGSLPAEASLLSRNAPLQKDPEYLKGLVDRVLSSRDPDAYVAISTAMGLSASGKETFFGPYSGSNSADYAWQLAGCRFGLDCSSNGALMTMYCSSAGICTNESNLEGVIFNNLTTRSEEAHIRQLVNDIVKTHNQRK
jgi:hypothetical protein